MRKKYTLPLSIFVVFENLNPVVWTAESFYPNSYMLYLNQSWLFSLNLFFKNDVFFSNSMLLESSAIDNKKNLNFGKKLQFFFKKSILLFYIYHFFFFKINMVLFTNYSNVNLNKLTSLDRIFKSAG